MRVNDSWDNVRILGRTPITEEGLELIWSGSGVEFIFNGTELGIEITAGSSVYQPWISLIMDGSWIMHMPVQEGKNKVVLLKGLDGNTAHNIRIVKDTQAMPDDEDSFVILNSILLDGELKKTPKYSYKLEFVGDSITSGEGLIGAHDGMDWISPYFGVEDHYAVMTAKALNAEYRLISQSGWGIVNSWDNNTSCILPLVYESEKCERDVHDHDFDSWKADAVIINLGTNDEGSFNNPEYINPVTGEVRKMHLREDGSYDPDDIKMIQEGVSEFLTTLRKDNPKALLVWVYGMLGNGIEEYLRKAVNTYAEEKGDNKAVFVALPNTQGDGYGSRQHPGKISHENAAQVITSYLKETL